MQFYSFLKEADSLFERNREGAFTWDVAAAVTGYLLHITEHYIWSPVEGYFLLALLTGADFAAAGWRAWKAGTFETRKALRVSYKLMAYTVLLFFAHNLARYEPALAFLPEAVFLPIVLMLMLSLVKNLSLLGVLPAGLAELLYRKIDVFKNQSSDSNSDKTI